MTTTRYPLAPLAKALGIRLIEVGEFAGNQHLDLPVGLHRIAAIFDVDVRTTQRWSSHGIPMTDQRRSHVEDICDEIRRHPATIWGPAWYDDEAEPDDGFPPLDDVVLEPCRRAAA